MVFNCVICSNQSTSLKDVYKGAAVGALIASNNCSSYDFSAYGAGNITNEPRFAGLPCVNCRLAVDSPCRNAGLALDWMAGAFDLDGWHRLNIFTGRPDMGAYEFLLRP